ncbi:MAG: FecR domain-containing protein [Bryobacterales bacterium]|nr:FecR domain-containing protein [Bryobacterales bacterium]
MTRMIAALFTTFALTAPAQVAISVRSGLIHHVEGNVNLDGQKVQPKMGQLVMVGEGQTLTTTDGRAELGLTPGVFFRMSPNSSFRMISNALTDTRLDVLSGTALVEVAELGKSNRITIRQAQSETSLLKMGLYRFDADMGQVRVVEGKAQVAMGGSSLTLTKNRMISVGDGLQASKFKNSKTDPLYVWSAQRALLVSEANISAAHALSLSGYRSSGSLWAWYPQLGMLAFIPSSGYLLSPFGWGYYSPGAVWQVYAPRYNQGEYGGGGGRGSWSGLNSGVSRGGMSSGGFGGGAPVRSSAPASAPAQTGGGGGGARGGR